MSYGHSVRQIGRDHYRLSWSFDVKIAGSRLRWPRTFTRDTDAAGAERFAEKWQVAIKHAAAPQEAARQDEQDDGEGMNHAG
jgi:hypothetical protein